jgi:hypothetical protein
MFGIMDVIFSVFKIGVGENKSKDKYKKYILTQNGDFDWICFLPWRTSFETAKKYHLLPSYGNLIIYEGPENLISDDPEKTKRAIEKIVDDFEKNYPAIKNHNLGFYGLSIGNLPAIHLANKYDCKKLISICPTDKLGEGIFQAFAARKIRKRVIDNGLDAQSYDKVIEKFNPINNIENLPADITIHIARFDRLVPFSGGLELAKKLKASKKNVKIHISNFYGHMMTMFLVGRKNKNKKRA